MAELLPTALAPLPEMPSTGLEQVAGHIQAGFTLYSALVGRQNGRGSDNGSQRELYYSNLYQKDIGEPVRVSPAENEPFSMGILDFPRDKGESVYATYKTFRKPYGNKQNENDLLDYHGHMRNQGESQGHEAGVIVIGEVYRRGDELFASEGLYYAWTSFSEKVHKPIDNLRCISALNVENDDTRDSIAAVHDHNNKSYEICEWTYDAKPLEFCALIGSVLGKTIVRILVDHYTALGKLQIHSIRTQEGGSGVTKILFRLRKE